jgi:hypothetical protein
MAEWVSKPEDTVREFVRIGQAVIVLQVFVDFTDAISLFMRAVVASVSTVAAAAVDLSATVFATTLVRGLLNT